MSSDNYYKSDFESELNDELFLSEMPLSLIEESIRQQFEYPLDFRKRDYIDTFIQKYTFTKENMTEDEILDGLDELHDKFLIFVMNIFEEYLDIGFVDLDTLPEDEQFNMIQIPYRFFIKHMKRNFTNLVMNYLEQHRTEIVDILPKRKDVTTNRLREELDDEEDITILANLDEVIEYIFNQEMDIDTFFSLCEGEESSMELDFTKCQFDEFNLTGNFVEKYKEMVGWEFRTSLESKLRNKILKKYPKKVIKKIKNDENEPLDED